MNTSDPSKGQHRKCEHHYMIRTKPHLTDEVIKDQSSFCSIPCAEIKTDRKRKVDKDWECFIIPQGIQFIQLVVCGQQVKPKLSDVCTYTVTSA